MMRLPSVNGGPVVEYRWRDGVPERRALTPDGHDYHDGGSAWQPMTAAEVAVATEQRTAVGQWLSRGPYAPRRSVRLPLSQPLQLVDEEAHTMGLGLTALLTADLSRYRRLADAATPDLTDWHWQLLSHVLSGIEAHRILSGDDSLPSPGAIAAEIDTWADGALNDDALRAGELRRQVMTWPPLTIAGVLMRLRRG